MYPYKYFQNEPGNDRERDLLNQAIHPNMCASFKGITLNNMTEEANTMQLLITQGLAGNYLW